MFKIWKEVRGLLSSFFIDKNMIITKNEHPRSLFLIYMNISYSYEQNIVKYKYIKLYVDKLIYTGLIPIVIIIQDLQYKN